MKRVAEHFIVWFNSLDKFLILFIILIANFLSFYVIGGEEQYFAFAKQFMEPEWMPHSFVLNQFPGTKLAFQIIAGTLLKFMTFEQLTFWGRIVNFLLFAFPLAKIFRYLKFTNIQMAFLFQLFYLTHQVFFAGEWIFKNLEEKSIAYIFIFYALYYLLRSNFKKSAIFAAIGTYFHLLVGGWFFLFLFIYSIVRKATFKDLLSTVSFYIIIVLPFFIYLYNGFFTGNTHVINGINTDRIYAYFRVPNHAGIFVSKDYFLDKHVEGVLMTLCIYLLSLFYFKRFKITYIQQLNTLNIIIISQQLIFIIIALFDHNGVLLKTYPFRTNGLSTFIFWIEAGLIVKSYGSKKIYSLLAKHTGIYTKRSRLKNKKLFRYHANVFMLIVLIPYFFYESYETIDSIQSFEKRPENAPMVHLMDYVKQHTEKDAVIMILDSDTPFCFTRITERERFVVYKFVPTQSHKIYEWYDRLQDKKKLNKDIHYLEQLRAKYKLDYIVSENRLKSKQLELLYRNNTYLLYRVLEK